MDDFATHIPNLSILYKDQTINKNIYLLSGHLVNNGNIDISPEMIERPLCCILPAGCSWLEFKITGTSQSLRAEGFIDDERNLNIEFGLFRRDENFSFQALVLASSDYTQKKPASLTGALLWKHRIKDLDYIGTTTIPEPDTRSPMSWTLKGLLLIAMIINLSMGLSMISGFGPMGALPSIAYERITNNKKTIVTLTPHRDGITTIREIETGNEQRVHLSDYTRSTSLKPIYRENIDEKNPTVLVGIFMTIASIVLFGSTFSSNIKRFRFRKIIANTIK
ncbi:hypothetical protein [Vogesella sp. XCS3]|uniref:hypothetical protein n=1 Tax=Vogesella sp. XCS3 TaxID=2877939 RepID=UPI001D0A9976|nr:hypothetical protein [Vogesella sp. XCS3]UDM18103.1 hypothetical protein LCH97_05390 [Vogesella sp. XCS3]